MGEAWTRRTVLAAAVSGVAGCSGTGTSPNRDPVETRTFPESYYQGPLVSAHEHMTGRDGSTRDSGTLERYTGFMGRNGVDRAMAITPPPLFSDVRGFGDRLIPFLFAHSFIRDGTDDFADRMMDVFEQHDFLQGLGEIGLYAFTDGSGLPLSPDMPQMLELYDFAAEKDVPVMIHAARPWNFPEETRDSWDSPLECPSIDQLDAAYSHNRDTEFLVHGSYFGTGDVTEGEMAAQALADHPNLFYDISAVMPVRPQELQGSVSQDRFERRFEEVGVEGRVDEYWNRYGTLLEEHSDRVLWGLDAGKEWHFTEWFFDASIDVVRALLGRLDEGDARNVGYRTAETLFGIEVEA